MLSKMSWPRGLTRTVVGYVVISVTRIFPQNVTTFIFFFFFKKGRSNDTHKSGEDKCVTHGMCGICRGLYIRNNYLVFYVTIPWLSNNFMLNLGAIKLEV